MDIKTVTHALLVLLTKLHRKGKGSPITSKGSGRFYAIHFSVSRHCDVGAYLLSVAVLPPPPPQRRAATLFLQLLM